eukprot:6885980-Pyramimonas_sp.AAC.1
MRRVGCAIRLTSVRGTVGPISGSGHKRGLHVTSDGYGPRLVTKLLAPCQQRCAASEGLCCEGLPSLPKGSTGRATLLAVATERCPHMGQLRLRQ